MLHPFTCLSRPAQNRAFWLLALLNLVLMAALQLLGAPLVNKSAPMGIISFELAGNLQAAQSMVASWDAQAKIYAGLNLGLDYLFMFAYAAGIALGCVWAADRRKPRSKTVALVGYALAWSQLLAALLDAIENYALIQLLLGDFQDLWPALAWWCAAAKFFFVLWGLLYMLSGLFLPGHAAQSKTFQNA